MRPLAAWALYGVGHAVSLLLHHVPDAWERTGLAGYRIYNRLMGASVRVQGEGGGPWQ